MARTTHPVERLIDARKGRDELPIEEPGEQEHGRKHRGAHQGDESARKTRAGASWDRVVDGPEQSDEERASDQHGRPGQGEEKADPQARAAAGQRHSRARRLK